MKTFLVLALCLATAGCAQLLDGDHDYVLGGSAGGSATSSGGALSTTPSGGEGGSTVSASISTTITCPGARSPCGGTCVDLASDPFNCGYCDHDCQGASCNDGLCDPTEIASDLCYPDALAVDLTHVYFSTEGNADCQTETGTIQRIAKTGGVPADTLSTSVQLPASLRLFEGHVYWADRLKRILQRCAKNGSGGTATLSEAFNYLDRIDVNAQGVYFTIPWSEVNGTGPGSIGRVPLTGGPTTWIAQNLDRPHYMALTDEAVYFGGSTAAGGPVPEQGFVASVPVNGGPVTKLAEQELRPQGIVVDSEAVYWLVEQDKAIRKKPLPNGPVETLATGQEDPHVLVQDEQHLYWTTITGGVIARVAKSGGPIQILASGRERPFSLGVDSKHVYWSESMPQGRIMRVPK